VRCGKIEEKKDQRPIQKHVSNEDDLRFDDTEDKACQRGLLK